MNKDILKTIVLLLVCANTLITSCTDKDYYDPTKDPIGQAPSTLDFSTSQTVKLVLNFDAPNGFKSTFKVYTQNPFENGVFQDQLEPIAAGIDISGTTHSRTIPSYIEELYLYSPNLFVPILSYAKIQNGVASFEDIGVNVPAEISSRAGNAGDMWRRPISKYIKTADDYYQDKTDDHFLYDLTPEGTDFRIESIPAEVMTAIGNTFPEHENLFNSPNNKYIMDANLHIVKGSDTGNGAKVYVSILYAGCSDYNSLSYFVYTGDKDDLSQLTKDEASKLELINLFQYADVNINKVREPKNRAGLTPGKYVQLLYKNEKGDYVEEFPVGAKIGWKLHCRGFQSASFTAQEDAESLFSIEAWNDPRKSGNNMEETRYSIYFQTSDNEGNLFNCFGFEDRRWEPDNDFNDLIFHVLTDPADALVPPPSIDEGDIEVSETPEGILAFEDNWPEKGDYDLNDVVVKYSSTIGYKQTGETAPFVEKVNDTFTFINNGANFTNMFSYKVGLSPSVIKSITITNPEGVETDYTNNITSDGSGFIIDVANNPLPSMVEKATPKSYTVVMEFNDGMVLQEGFNKFAAPYNPFITPKGNKFETAEVHLSMYPPTSRVNTTLFGSEDDRSDPAKNTWYVSGENNKYPFAIHLAGSNLDFQVSTEGQPIEITYPRYIDWVESGMTTEKDWYTKK